MPTLKTNTTKQRAKQPDPRQHDFFRFLSTALAPVMPEAVPAPPEPDLEPLPGRYDDNQMVRRLINSLIAASGVDRETLAARMTPLAGHRVTKSMLDSWTGSGRPNAFPLHTFRALIRACDAGPDAELALLTALLDGTGWSPMDAKRAELARIGQFAGAALWAFGQAQQLVGKGWRP